MGGWKYQMVWIRVQETHAPITSLYSVEVKAGRYGAWSSWNWSRCSRWACTCSSIAKLRNLYISASSSKKSWNPNGSSSQTSICAKYLPLWLVVCQSRLRWQAWGSDETTTVLTDIQGLEKTTLEIWTLRFKVLVTGLQPFKWVSRFKNHCRNLDGNAAQARKLVWNPWRDWSNDSWSSRPELAQLHRSDTIQDWCGQGVLSVRWRNYPMTLKIDIDEEGNVSIYSSDQAAINRAKEIIAGLVRES